jgi:hypothetical protein
MNKNFEIPRACLEQGEFLLVERPFSSLMASFKGKENFENSSGTFIRT